MWGASITRGIMKTLLGVINGSESSHLLTSRGVMLTLVRSILAATLTQFTAKKLSACSSYIR